MERSVLGSVRRLACLMLLCGSSAACIVEERPRTELLEGGITLDEPDGAAPERDAAARDAAAEPDSAARNASSVAGDAGSPAQGQLGVRYASGTRLRAMVLHVEGGATRVVGWFDRSLGAQCRLAPGATGSLLCLPNTSSAQRYFADAKCLEPVWARAPSACAESETLYAAESTPAERCGTGQLVAIRRLTPSRLDPSTPLFQLSGESCALVNGLSQVELFEASEPLPWSDFASVAKRDKFGGLPDHEQLSSSDGASIPGDEFDRSGAACNFVNFGAQSYCVGEPVYTFPEGPSGSFGDTQCSAAPLARASSCPGTTPPALLLKPEPAHCSFGVYRRGAAQSASYWLGSMGRCEAQTATELGDVYYGLGEPVPLSELTPAKRVLDGTARFRVAAHRDDHDRTLFVENTYRDTLLNTSCQLRPLPGRGYYCAPESAATLYADGACTKPLLNVRASACAEPSEAFLVDSPVTQECGAVGRVVRRGAAFTATGMLFSKNRSSCVAAPSFSGALYEVGADVPPELVAVFPIVTE